MDSLALYSQEFLLKITAATDFFHNQSPQEAYEILMETENQLTESSLNHNTGNLKYPEWFLPWREAILNKDLTKIPFLTLPPKPIPSSPDLPPDISKVLSLYNDDKLSEAVTLLNNLRKSYNQTFNEIPEIPALESDYQEVLDVLALADDKIGWVSESEGTISVKYKKIPGTETYSLLTESVINVPMKNYITLIYETDLYHNWIPFCTRSYTISKLSRSRKILVQEFNVRFVPNRHTCAYGFGANLLSSHGCVVITAKSCDQGTHFKNIALPLIPSTRAQVNIMACIIKPISHEKIHVTMITNYDPNMSYVPYKILNWFSKKLAKGIFKKVEKLAKNFKGSVYEKRINSEENREFYRHLEESEREYLGN